MFLIRWTKTIVSLPLVWAGRLAGLLQMPWGTPLLKMAWAVGGDGEVALSALRGIQSRIGPESARAQALEWMVWRPQPEIAAWAGLTALGAGDLPAARMFLSQGQHLGPDRGGLIELLEYLIASESEDPGAMTELTGRLELRKDLSAAVSRLLQVRLLWNAVFQRRWEDAQQRASRLWSIESEPAVAVALWALAQRNGNAAQARHYLEGVQMPEPQMLYFMAVGYMAIGRREEAQKTVSSLQTLDAALAQRTQQHLDRMEPAP
jgi:hypothetical protein